MPFSFFTIPVRDDGSAAAELNSFLRSHRILTVDRKWVDQGTDSFWAFCVDYHVSGSSSDTSTPLGKTRGKDYREILSPEDFSRFAALRELRKDLAARDGIPVYTIFTNEQLAQIVQTKSSSKSDLKKIEGVGEARIEKYAAAFLDKMAEMENSTNHETDEKPVSEDH